MCGAIWRGVVYHIYLVTSCWFGTGRASLGVSMDPQEGAQSWTTLRMYMGLCLCGHYVFVPE